MHVQKSLETTIKIGYPFLLKILTPEKAKVCPDNNFTAYVYTGCWLGLSTNVGCLLGLGTIFYYKLMLFWPKHLFLQWFQWAWWIFLDPLYLILCYNSAYIPGFWARCFHTLLSICLRFSLKCLFKSHLGVWLRLIGHASICSHLSILSPVASFLA